MKSLKDKRHLFFDLDDTLWDFQANSERVLRQLYQERNLKEKLGTEVEEFLEEYKRVNLLFWSLFGQGKITKVHLREQRFKESLKRFRYENEEENQILTREYLARAPKGNQLKQGCLEILEYLREKYELHILTNGFREIQAIKIDSGGIRHYFRHILISEEHGLYKPDMRIFRLAEKISGGNPKECVMIGDNLENDIYGAVNAGWEAIHLDNDNSSEFEGHKIAQLYELKEIL